MMSYRNIRFLLISLVLFHGLVAKGSAGRPGVDGLLLNSHHSDNGKAEETLLNCGLDLSVIREQVKSSSSIHDKSESSSGFDSIRKAINLLSTKVDKTFLDCLSKQRSFPVHVDGEDGLRNWFIDYLESSLSHPTARSLIHARADTSAPTPSPSRSPAPSQSPAKSPHSAPSQSPAKSPHSAPARKIQHASPPTKSSTSSPPTSHSKKKPDPYDGLFNTPPPPSSHKQPDTNDDDNSPSKVKEAHDEDTKELIIAVVLTALGTTLLCALLFLCYVLCRRKKEKTMKMRKDDNFQMTSGGCIASSQAIDPNKIGALPLKTEVSKEDSDASSDTTILVATESGVPGEKSDGPKESSESSGNAFQPQPPPPPPFMPAPPPPGPPPPPKAAPRPPGPPKAAFPPRKGYRPSPLGPKQSGGASSSEENEDSAGKTKLKPFFWDKVAAKPDQPMVWDNLKAGSFQFNEERIETLFGYNAADKNKADGKKESGFKDNTPQYVRILDPKKAQNLAISLKALNVKAEEVCDALNKGNELPSELLQTLMKMPPTADEELKLRLFNDPDQLGPAEQFLRALVEIPFAYQRMEALLFMASLPEEATSTTEAFSTLEVACQELKNSRLFLKLLEAVLKTGNRMNDGTYRGGAQAIKLDTLLKLSDVKGTDGKTTLLHFVVQEIIRSEGVRAARMARENQLSTSSLNPEDLTDVPPDSGEYFRNLGLKRISGLSDELENVKKAACLDADVLSSTVANLGESLLKTKAFMKNKMEGVEECEFVHTVNAFLERAETDITKLLEDEKRIRALVKDTTDYFHGGAGKEEGFRLFVIVRDFLGMLDKVCRQVREAEMHASKTSKTSQGQATSNAQDPTMSPARDTVTMSPARDPRQLLFPAIKGQRPDSDSDSDFSSSDED